RGGKKQQWASQGQDQEEQVRRKEREQAEQCGARGASRRRRWPATVELLCAMVTARCESRVMSGRQTVNPVASDENSDVGEVDLGALSVGQRSSGGATRSGAVSVGQRSSGVGEERRRGVTGARGRDGWRRRRRRAKLAWLERRRGCRCGQMSND
ncbi:hypothetical protein U1Q18_044281, partial [Sarracenia purpurea var. burkii]